MGVRRAVYRVLVGKPEGKRPLGRLRHKWEDIIKKGSSGSGCGGMNWTELAQDRDRWWALINTVMNLWFPQNVGNFMTGCKLVSFLRRTVLCGVSE
jgi:hypothetical protein